MRYFLSLMILIGLISCKKPVRQNNEITKVELARCGAWSDPGAAISIDTSLNYHYFGLLNKSNPANQSQKYYQGKATEGFYDTLNKKFDQIKYKTLDTTDNGYVTDVNYFELIIHWQTGKRRIIRIDTGGNTTVMKTLKWLDSSYKNIKLHQVKIPFKFETVFQDPPHPNPIQIRFPPPIKRHKLLN